MQKKNSFISFNYNCNNQQSSIYLSCLSNCMHALCFNILPTINYDPTYNYVGILELYVS